jgi:ribosomal protein S18 acetylase RimI-like enzyme
MPVEVATLNDLDRILELWVALAEEQREHGTHLTVEPNRELIRESLAQRIVDQTCLVARRAEAAGDTAEIVGFLSFDHERNGLDRDVERGVIENLYVVPESRGEGLGTALLEVAEAALAGAGADRIVLEAMAGNDAARRFYEAQGYRPHRITYERPAPDGKDTKAGG